MIRPSRALFIACLAVAAPACAADSGDSMFILFNQVPNGEGGDCTIPTAAGNEFRQSGRMDVTAPEFATYEFYPVVESRLESLGDDLQRTISIRGAEITLSEEGGGFSDSFTRLFSGSLPPGGQGTFLVDLLDAGHLDELAGGLGAGDRTTVVAEVVIFGDVSGGEIESDPFLYPIDLCNGCLIADLGACDTIPEGFVADSGGECNPFQDSNVECCELNGNQVCPAIGTMTTTVL